MSTWSPWVDCHKSNVRKRPRVGETGPSRTRARLLRTRRGNEQNDAPDSLPNVTNRGPVNLNRQGKIRFAMNLVSNWRFQEGIECNNSVQLPLAWSYLRDAWLD